MMSTAGQTGRRTGSSSSGSRVHGCQGTQASTPAPTGSGQFENSEDADHAGHYLAICEMVQRHVGEGTVLDVGCGSGRLYHYLTQHAGMPAACYTGVDCCGDAVRAAAARFPEAGFSRRDYGREAVASRFDCVIFNDSLHCFDDPAAILDKCVDRNMHACSVLIIAMAAGQYDALWPALAGRYRLVDEQTVRNGDGSAWLLHTFKLAGSRRHC